jgi:hypothetical protein
MNLIDRYVAEVGRHLPEKTHADIEKEIRSTLEDMLEDRSRTTGRPVDDDMIVEVLKEFGSPGKVAASYLPERYLIGPQLYPYFLMVMKIALLVAFIVALISLSVGILRADPTIDAIISSIIQSVLNAAGIAITIIGNVVLVFAIMERTLPHAEIKELSPEWDPRTLPEETSKSERVNTGNLIGEIVFTVAALLIFNFYPQILGVGFPVDGKWVFIPVLAAVFFTYLPWLNLHWGLELIQNAILLRDGRWQPATRWLSVAVGLFGIGITYAILQGPSIVALTTESLRVVGISDPSAAVGLTNLIDACVRLGLIVAIIVQVIQVSVTVYRLLAGDRKIIDIPELK